VKNKLPEMKDPIDPEEYIKSKVFKYNGKKVK
jgi:hypothetical protein